MLQRMDGITAISFFQQYGLEMWENSAHNWHVRSGETNATQQWEISVEYAGIYVHTRTRSSTTANWGAWTSWKKVVSF